MLNEQKILTSADTKIDFSNTKNLLIVSITLGVGLGLSGLSLVGDVTGNYAFKVMIGDVEISALAIATVLAIILNLIILPTKEEVIEDVEDVKTVSLSQASGIGIEGLDVVKEENNKTLENKKKKRFYWFSFNKNKDNSDNK